tara:strand:- start:975 stop:1496 length:522 start_codon:yes stop_codon:yes gene_type:complete
MSLDLHLKELADDCFKFINPQSLWQHPRADCYLLYALRSHIYKCTAPFWLEAQEIIFPELKLVVDKPTVSYFALIKHTDRSFSLPIGNLCPSSYGFYFTKTNGAYIIQGKSTNLAGGLQALDTHSPELVNWEERDQFWFKLQDGQFHTSGNLHIATILPQEGTTFYHVEFNDD